MYEDAPLLIRTPVAFSVCSRITTLFLAALLSHYLFPHLNIVTVFHNYDYFLS